MVLIFATKFVPVTPVYHDSIVFPPISVSVNYLNDTTVGQNRLTLLVTTVTEVSPSRFIVCRRSGDRRAAI
jgi:hypothetical protein